MATARRAGRWAANSIDALARRRGSNPLRERKALVAKVHLAEADERARAAEPHGGHDARRRRRAVGRHSERPAASGTAKSAKVEQRERVESVRGARRQLPSQRKLSPTIRLIYGRSVQGGSR